MKSLRNILAAGILSLASIAQAADITGNFKWFQSGAKQPANGTFESYQETNAWYSLPGNIKGYSFLDVYADTSDRFYSKNTLTRNIAGNLNAAAQVRCYQEPFTDAGLGVKLNIPVSNGYASISALPLWIDKKGHEEEKSTFAFTLGKDLGRGFNFESFGELKYVHSRLKWNYGELELTRKFGPFKIGYSGALQPSGKSIPKIEHRAIVRADWKFGSKR